MINKDCPLIDCGNWLKPVVDENVRVMGYKLFCEICRHSMATFIKGTSCVSLYNQLHITPEQYLERTGEKFPDEGRVWYRHISVHPKNEPGPWLETQYFMAVDSAEEGKHTVEIYCILPPLPPDNNYGRENGLR